MRKIFVICMLLVMPLRGFIGDAMAYEMLMSDQPSVPSAHIAASKSDLKQAAERPPCHMESAPALDDEPQQSKCTACQACHFSAVIYSGCSAHLATANQAAPVQSLGFWHSAELVRLAKPPVL
jgi:hypothetical protein